MTKRLLGLGLGLAMLCGLAQRGATAELSATNSSAAKVTNALALTGAALPAKVPAAKPTPGVEAAQAISTITGVAISPLLGVGAVGAVKYYRTPEAARGRLPWFAQPWFFVPALVLVA